MVVTEFEPRKNPLPRPRTKASVRKIKIQASAAGEVSVLIESRVSSLRTVSILLMAATLTAVLGGIALIFYAGELSAAQRQSQIDGLLKVSESLRLERSQAVDEMKKIEIARSASEKELSDLFAEMTNAEAKIKALMPFGPTAGSSETATNDPEIIAKMRREQQDLANLNSAYIQASARHTAAKNRNDGLKTSLDAQKTQLDNRLKEIDKQQNELTEKVSNSSSNTSFDYNSMLIRVVAVFLIMFLVQTFITIFRYTMRLAAYYQARIDALKLLNGSDVLIEDLQKITLILSPESYDFGKVAKTPAEQAVELAKELLRGQGKKLA